MIGKWKKNENENYTNQHILGSHTHDRIKKQYNEILNNFKLQDKVYKKVTDQASNMKAVFANIIENLFQPKPMKSNQQKVDEIAKLFDNNRVVKTNLLT